jgi:3-phosphoshikimate 1-carboxyvinyltransferase
MNPTSLTLRINIKPECLENKPALQEMSNTNYPLELEIIPLQKPPQATATVPGSKSITNRALVLAALSSRQGSRVLTGALRSEDTEVMLNCLGKLGFEINTDWQNDTITIEKNKSERIIPETEADLFVGNSGTTVRFLTAMLSLGQGCYRLDGVARMRERPIQDLLDTLTEKLGVRAISEMGNGCPPVQIVANGKWRRGTITVRSSVSSQFLSGLLLAAPFADHETEFYPDGELVSEPYVEMTVRMLQEWGFDVDGTGGIPRAVPQWVQLHPEYRVNPKQNGLVRTHYAIEPDASAASYFWAAAAISGGRVTVSGLTRKSLQGDVRFVDLLEQMGCRVEECEAGITVHGGKLHGIDAEMNDISDTVMTLSSVACFAEGPTTIRNVAHIRHKETDRIAALATELRKLGAKIEERSDGLTITPAPLRGCAVDTYNDHRMAMSLALIGLKVPEVVIRNPGCVAKTYPGFWEDLFVLRQS